MNHDLPADPAPASPAPPDTSAYALLDLPVAWTDAAGRLLGANPAFQTATGRPLTQVGSQTVVDLLGLAPAGDDADHASDRATDLVIALAAGHDFAPRPFQGRDATGRPLTGLLGQRCRAGLRVITLQPTPADAAASAGAERAEQLLELAQRLGKLGVWERNLRTRVGRWEPAAWRFWDLEPQAGAPAFETALQSAHPDDRAALAAAYDASQTRLGKHAHRFRVLQPGRAVRDVRLSWEVLPGADGLPERALGIIVDDTETILLARSLDEAQAQFDMAVTLADIAIWRHDAGSGRLHCNDLGWSLLGLAPQRDGMPLADLVDLLHPDDLASVLAQAAHATQAHGADGPDGPIDLGARCRHADGRWRYLLTRRVARRDAQGGLLGHVGVALDLSARHDQQQHGLALAQRLEMATAAAGVGIWSVDLGDPTRVHWDEQMRALHGLGPDAPAPGLADYIAELVHGDDRASTTESMATLLQRRDGLLDMDLRILRPDGQVRRLATRSSISSANGRRQVHGVMLDVTERHLTENQLRQAHERAALAARGAGIGTWESDADAKLGWWDEQMFRLRGREPMHGPVPAETMIAWLHPPDREVQARAMQAALDKDAPTNIEFRVVLPDGSLRWLASRSAPVRDEHGRTVRRIGINWDITDQRNAAAAREERLAVQRESQAKSRFLARISHELRTPLNAVLGFSQLLLADGGVPDPATWRRRVEHVLASGEHLLALIDDVLELSSLESGELPLSLQPVALAPLAQTSLPLVELLAREHGITLHLGGLDGWALADPVRLRQVLLNLLSNAIKYNRPAGRVTVSAARDAGWLLLRVEDTGRGLDADQISHLFEPFNRLGVDREGIAGTGIGLAIVQASVQHMGGTVRVHSQPGQGSCFEICLQAVAAPRSAAMAIATPSTTTTTTVGTTSAAADGAAPHAAPTPGAPVPATIPPVDRPDRGSPGAAETAPAVRLLYIEDNEVNLLIVSELVRCRSDIAFLEAVDGATGLAAARTHQPALILLDMQLPDMDGHEVLRRLRADPATADIRCIALSANAMPADILRARQAGFADYWTKPLDLKAFLRAMDTLFGPAPV